MLERGWISPVPLEMAIAIKSAIRDLPATSRCQNAFTLALIAEVVEGASNVKFGPELYCGLAKVNHDVFRPFAARVRSMAADLRLARPTKARADVFQGDARDLPSAIGNRRRLRED